MTVIDRLMLRSIIIAVDVNSYRMRSRRSHTNSLGKTIPVSD